MRERSNQRVASKSSSVSCRRAGGFGRQLMCDHMVHFCATFEGRCHSPPPSPAQWQRVCFVLVSVHPFLCVEGWHEVRRAQAEQWCQSPPPLPTGTRLCCGASEIPSMFHPTPPTSHAFLPPPRSHPMIIPPCPCYATPLTFCYTHPPTLAPTHPTLPPPTILKETSRAMITAAAS